MRPGDLNLLLHFDALMSTRSVSRAAEELGISQPAMSAALSRLRRLFNDPLFEREGGIWRPTPKAEDLHGSFRPMLDMWREVSLPRDAFDPSTARRAITVFGTDYVQLGSGDVVVAGGAPTPEIYDAREGVFRSVQGTLGATRLFLTATGLDRGVLLVGGYDLRIQPTAAAWVIE